MEKGPVTPCDFAKVSYLSAFRCLTVWNVLLLVFGTTVVLFLVVAILMLIHSSFLPGALTTLGTIVNGAGIAWVANQKRAPLSEEREAFRRLEKVCAQPGMGLIGIEKQPWLKELRSLARKSLVWQSKPSQGDASSTPE